VPENARIQKFEKIVRSLSAAGKILIVFKRLRQNFHGLLRSAIDKILLVFKRRRQNYKRKVGEIGGSDSKVVDFSSYWVAFSVGDDPSKVGAFYC
jgi:hypothetical protein